MRIERQSVRGAVMQVIFQGHHSSEEAAESLASIIHLFRERYGIENFRQVCLSVTLLDQEGQDVELVDVQSSEVFSIFEVIKSENHLQILNDKAPLKLVIDNTDPTDQSDSSGS